MLVCIYYKNGFYNMYDTCRISFGFGPSGDNGFGMCTMICN